MVRISKTKLFMAVTLGGALGGLSANAVACSDSPYVGSVCAMAVMDGWTSFGNNQYLVAAGQTMQIRQYQALYAILGTTFGGDGVTTFALPDLRGRMIVGAGPAYKSGATGGNATVQLSQSQLPAANLRIVATVDLSKVTAATTLSGLSATANLSGLAASGNASGLTMKVVSNNNNQPNPANNYLGRNAGITTASYSNMTPDTTLNPNAIAGTVSVAFANGTTAPVAISGAGTTTIGGTASVAGSTDVMGAGMAIPIMPPYLSMTYFIAVNGIFPSRD